MNSERLRIMLSSHPSESFSQPYSGSKRVARYRRTIVPDKNQVTVCISQDNFVPYADEGESNTHRDRLVKDCRAGKFDYIVTRSLTQFAPAWDETKRLIRELKELNPPVGIFFETEMISTLDDRFDLWLATMETLAEMESREKSRRMIMGIRPTFQLNQEDSNA